MAKRNGFRQICLFVLLLASTSCVSGQLLESRMLKDRALIAAGGYQVILYGRHSPNDLESVAFLDKAGDDYELRPYAPAFEYRVIGAADADQAYATAKGFLDHLNILMAIETRAISGPDGRVIGYELRPLFMPENVGLTDPLLISYVLGEDNIVRVYISRRQEEHDRLIF